VVPYDAAVKTTI